MKFAIAAVVSVIALSMLLAQDTLMMWPANPKNGAIAFESIGGAGNYTFQIARREGRGGAEVHKNWTYVFAAQTGEATIVYGGQVENLRERDAAVDDGEMRGSTLVNAKTQKVGPGDIVLIPAGLPYQIIVEAGKAFNFFVTKMQKK